MLSVNFCSNFFISLSFFISILQLSSEIALLINTSIFTVLVFISYVNLELFFKSSTLLYVFLSHLNEITLDTISPYIKLYPKDALSVK